jgi:HlyD family secretion protein
MASSKRKWWILGLIIAVVVLGVLAYMKSKSKPKGKEVTIDKVDRRTIVERVTASGKIFPETEVKISSDVSGEIVELFIEEGDSIIAGQLLAKIDPDTYISAVERGEASLNNSKANLAMAESQIENNIAQKENIIAQLKNAERIHERNI